MKFYHGTNQYGLDETKRQGFLLHKRRKGMSPCTYLAVKKEHAEIYGDIVLEVEYDPFLNKEMNNYCEGCWQLRVYEPIKDWEVLPKTFSDHLREVKGKAIYFDGKDYWRKGVNKNGK